MRVGELIRGLREDRDLKQQDVADAIRVSRQAYASYETGASAPPIEVLIALAEYYQVSVDYLVGLIEYRTYPDVLDQTITVNVTARRLLAVIRKLDETEREQVVDYVELQWFAHQVRNRKKRKIETCSRNGFL